MEKRMTLGLCNFTPIEKNENEKCIWCLKKSDFNKAHIFSKKLLVTNHPNNYLRKSVCTLCNNKFSKIENFIYQNSPIVFFAQEFFSKKSELKKTPFFIRLLHEGIYLVSNRNSLNRIHPQICLNKTNTLIYIDYIFNNDLLKNIKRKLTDEIFTIDEKPQLPNDFKPILLNLEGKLIIICKDREFISEFINQIVKTDGVYYLSYQSLHKTSGKLTTDRVLLFLKFSQKHWVMLNYKFILEFLALNFGSDFVLMDCFNFLREEFKRCQEIGYFNDVNQYLFDDNKPNLDFLNFKINIENMNVSLQNDKLEGDNSLTLFLSTNNKEINVYSKIGWFPTLNIEFKTDDLKPNMFLTTYDYKTNELSNYKLTNLKEKTSMLVIKKNGVLNPTHYKDYLF